MHSRPKEECALMFYETLLVFVKKFFVVCCAVWSPILCLPPNQYISFILLAVHCIHWSAVCPSVPLLSITVYLYYIPFTLQTSLIGFTSCKSIPGVFSALKMALVFKKCMYMSVSVCIKSIMHWRPAGSPQWLWLLWWKHHNFGSGSSFNTLHYFTACFCTRETHVEKQEQD